MKAFVCNKCSITYKEPCTILIDDKMLCIPAIFCPLGMCSEWTEKDPGFTACQKLGMSLFKKEFLKSIIVKMLLN